MAFLGDSLDMLVLSQGAGHDLWGDFVDGYHLCIRVKGKTYE